MKTKATPASRLLFTTIIALALISCKKESSDTPAKTGPVMEYFSFNDREIRENTGGFSIDVDHDGRNDLAFTTLLVGDPLNQVDKRQFLVSSNIQVNLPVNGNEEIPVMNSGDAIVLNNFNGYQWFELSAILLVQKITSFNAPVRWEGRWKNVSHKYMPYQLLKNNDRYNGWIEISVDIANGKVIVHRAAISKEPNRAIKAGQ